MGARVIIYESLVSEITIYSSQSNVGVQKGNRSLCPECARRYAKSLKGSQRFPSRSCESGFGGQGNGVQTQSWWKSESPTGLRHSM